MPVVTAYAYHIIFRILLLLTYTTDIVELTRVVRVWSGGAMVLDKLPVPGRPTSLDDSKARAYCACSRCGCRLFGHFYSSLSCLSSFSLSLGDGPI